MRVITMGQEYIYYAFVSYSHKDKEWAEWIWDAIEHYRLPAIIRKEVQKPLPKKMRPVFLDKADLGAGVLEENLRDELVASRYLVVICSPNSARPNEQGDHFVDTEVRHFCEMGRKEKIIPVLVEGTPEEAFCPKIREAGLKAINATELSRARVLNDVVAKILGLKPDALWRRAERERKKRLLIKSAIGGFLGLLAAFVGYFVWDANRTVVNYYADYVDSFGLPEGIFPLTKEEIKRRHFHYRFEYRGYGFGKSVHHDSSDWNIFKPLGFYRILRQVTMSNSAGVASTINIDNEFLDARPCVQVFHYEQSGLNMGYRLAENREGNAAGKLLRRIVYSARHHGVVNGLMGFFGVGEGRENMLFGYSTQSGLRSTITQHELVRDARGRVVQRRFLNAIGGMEADSQGVCAIDCYDLDRYGRIVQQRHLTRSADGVDLVRHVDKTGIAGREFSYEESSPNLRRVTYFGEKSKMVLGPERWCTLERDFGDDGHIAREVFFGVDGEKILNIYGFAERRMTYNESGNCIRQDMMGVNGSPIVLPNGYSGAAWRYDEYGRDIECRFIGTTGEQISNNQGVFMVRKRYDAKGNIDMVENVDADGNVRYDNNGIACVGYEYSDVGYLTKISYFGSDHNPTLYNGYFQIVNTYDRKGRNVKVNYYGFNRERVFNESGVSIIKKSYDDYGREKEESYYGKDEEQVVSKLGYHALAREYDKCGYEKKKEYLGIDRERTMGPLDVAGYVYDYDGLGNCEKVTSIGLDGLAKVGRYSGFATEWWEYNSIGQKIRCRYLDENGNRTVSWDGIAGLSIKYDEAGHVVEECYFDKEDNPAMHKFNGAKKRFAYNTFGKKISEECFDTEGRLWANYSGIAKTEYQYDDRGLEVRTLYFGENGKLTRDIHGVSVITKEYDERYRLVRERFFDEEGRPSMTKPYLAPFHYAEKRQDYDQHGRLCTECFFDNKGNPIDSASGQFAMRQTSYNVRGQVAEVRYLNALGDLVPCDDAYCAVRFDRDSLGHVTNECYFSKDGHLTTCKFGYAIKKSTHAPSGKCIRIEHFGTNCERVVSTYHDGESIREHSFDRNNRLTCTKLFGVDEKPMIGRFEYAEERRRYDIMGNVSCVEYYGTNGVPVLALLGAAGCEKKYDTTGHVTSERYFGTDRNPITNSLGYVECRIRYDDKGKETLREYFDAAGNRSLGFMGVAGVMSEYDSGQKINEAYFGIDGALMPCNEGFVEKRMTYAKQYQVECESYWGASGNLVKARYLDAIGFLKLYDKHGKHYGTAYFDLSKVGIFCSRIQGYDNGKPTRRFVKKEGKDGLWQNDQCIGKELCNKLTMIFKDRLEVMRKKGIIVTQTTCCNSNSRAAVDLYAPPDRGGICGYANVNHACFMYDGSGNETNRMFWAVDGSPTVGDNQVHRTCREFSQVGGKSMLVREWYLDHTGNPTLDCRGAAGWKVSDLDKAYGDNTPSFLDLDGTVLKMVPIVIFSEVVENSIARRLGVCVNDIVCRYGEYSIKKADDFKTLASSILRLEDASKTLRIARRTKDGTYEIRSFVFPPGKMGLRFADTAYRSDWYSKIVETYCEKEKGEKK